MKLKYAVTHYESKGPFTVTMFQSIFAAWLHLLVGRLNGRKMAMRRYR